MAEQPRARLVAQVFAVLAALFAPVEAAFAAFLGVRAAANPCEPDGSGVCAPMGYTTVAAFCLIAAAPVVLVQRIRRPGTVGTSVAVGVLGVVVAPLLAFGLLQLAANSIG
ncbi:hypothetical protein ABT324_06180 [Saccharopolyspora sp. NPDC000359]|uniref:hypothetical protein n=1 Tax=Saccharopolyspora sp. NPDC000359 TaxID=3154251 RepID=UPI00332730E3